MTKPFIKALETGRGYVPLDLYIGRAGERFGRAPEEIEAGDCYNIRVNELLGMADASAMEKASKPKPKR